MSDKQGKTYIIQEIAGGGPDDQGPKEVKTPGETIRGPEHARRYLAKHKVVGTFRVLMVCDEFKVAAKKRQVEDFVVE